MVSFRPGNFQGAAKVTLLGADPTGEELPRQDIPVFFEGITKGANSGVNLVIDLTVGLRDFGELWFDVLLDEKFITRIPLQAVAALHSEGDAVSGREDSEGGL